VTDFYPAKPDVDVTAKNRADFAVFMKGATFLADAVPDPPQPRLAPDVREEVRSRRCCRLEE
jgi:hypothetical protein